MRDDVLAKPIDDPKGRSIRGGATAIVSQSCRFAIRTGTMMLMARLLSPEEFGLQGMVLAMTGFLGLFRDAGLSTVTVQRDTITHAQISTLFWINVAVGMALTALMIVVSPAIASFYHDPRVVMMTIVSAPAFLFNALSVQHYALLQRHMRFVALAVIELAALLCSTALGLAMAMRGYGYWALVGMTVALPLATTIGCWLALPWRPGLPARDSGLRSMLSMGGIVTFNTFVVYVAYNTEKVLLGRFWGPEALGLYGRAYQLISLPSDLLISAIASVALPSLSRLQNDPERLHRAFLRSYAAALSLAIPATLSCALFAGEIVNVMLGPKWRATVPIFRLMTPTILAFALINPFNWFLVSSGRARRSLYISFLVAPVVILGAVGGMRFGPQGVAIGFSSMMLLLTVPVIAWARAGTAISGLDVWKAVRGPIAAGAAAALGGYITSYLLQASLPILPLVAVGSAVVCLVYFLVLLYLLGHRDSYVDLVRQLMVRPAAS